MTNEIYPCPKCRSNNLEILKKEFDNEVMKNCFLFKILCKNCEFLHGLYTSEESARYRWNLLPREDTNMNAEFKVYMLSSEGIEKANYLAELFNNFLNELKELCPESRELSIVKTKLEEACFFAKKSIAKDPENQRVTQWDASRTTVMIQDK